MQVSKFVTICLLTLTASTVADAQQVFIVIVNPKNTASQIEKKDLSDIFLKKTTKWNNEIVRPVDLSQNSTSRRKFSEDVLNRTVLEVKNYWLQRVFSGRDVPPPELKTDAEVIDYVLKFPSAIGYVSSDTNVSNVKVLTVK